MEKFNGILSYMLDTETVALDTTILKFHDVLCATLGTCRVRRKD